MRQKESRVHPYIPNSIPQVRQSMLQELGKKSVDEMYDDIPRSLRIQGLMRLPAPLESEYMLRKHIDGLLDKNKTTRDYLSFLGSGCAPHYVPAIVDEIVQRAEFLTAYAGDPYEDFGRWQAMFEYQSMMGELLNMDVVNVPTYDGSQAACTAVRMASRITGRSRVLIADTISPDRLMVLRNYLKPDISIAMIRHDTRTSLLDIDDLRSKIDSRTCGVYFENPTYYGLIESTGPQTTQIAHDAGALAVVGVDPISLGVLAPPADWGADIVCGDLQPLGIHMNYGGALAGFIATRDEPRFVMEYPSRLFGITKTAVPGEYGFGDVAFDRTSFMGREEGKEFVGTAAALLGITAGVYMAMMGPEGMAELGEGIIRRARYACSRLSEIPGVKAPLFIGPHFKEFIVNFDGTGRSVRAINEALFQKGIFGGKDISDESGEMGQSSIYCVTDTHTQADIDHLVSCLREVLK